MKKINFKKFPLRICRSFFYCKLCKDFIVPGELYRDEVEEEKGMKKAARKIAQYGEGKFLVNLRDKNRFKVLPDGWVRDNLLGIDWGKSNDETIDFKAAQKYCKKQGGRLPTREELITLIDDTRRSPAINTAVFPDTKTDDWYWTGTPLAGSSDDAWVVYFNYGYVLYYNKDLRYYVRPVRSSQ